MFGPDHSIRCILLYYLSDEIVPIFRMMLVGAGLGILLLLLVLILTDDFPRCRR